MHFIFEIVIFLSKGTYTNQLDKHRACVLIVPHNQVLYGYNTDCSVFRNVHNQLLDKERTCLSNLSQNHAFYD